MQRFDEEEEALLKQGDLEAAAASLLTDVELRRTPTSALDRLAQYEMDTAETKEAW